MAFFSPVSPQLDLINCTDGADSNDTAIVNFPNQKIFFYLEKDETAYKWKTMSSEANMGSINSIQIRYDQL